MVDAPTILQGNEVHLWHINLGLNAEQVRCCHRVLSQDEERRAERFHFDRHRNQFVAGRGAMRFILAQYLSIPPRAVEYCYGPNGKPELSPSLQLAAIRFNLSHSNGHALLGVCREYALGVDLEFVNYEFAGEEIAERFFSAGEVARLRSMPPGERGHAFFSCWTRKEAYIKALGVGLSLPLESFDVSFGPGVSPALLRADLCPADLQRWKMYDLVVPAGYAAALVIEGEQHKLSEKSWEPPIS